MKKNGFTLLEVIIATAITGLALGTLFGLLGGSKRLAFKAYNEIDRIIILRAAINNAQLVKKSDYPNSPKNYAKKLSVNHVKIKDKLDELNRKTQKIRYGLDRYTIDFGNNKNLENNFNGVRWRKLETPK
jgi:general secretion pathway protein I